MSRILHFSAFGGFLKNGGRAKRRRLRRGKGVWGKGIAAAAGAGNFYEFLIK